MAPVAVCLIIVWNLCEGAIRGNLSWTYVVAALVEGLIEGVFFSLAFVLLENMKYREGWWEIFSQKAGGGKEEERQTYPTHRDP